MILANFQIRSNVEWMDQEAGLFRVRKEDMGGLIEIGNYPFDQMVRYTIGRPSKKSPKETILTKDFYYSLTEGIMPGATVSFDTKREDIYKQLGKPDEEFGWKGANYLRYGDYAYSVAFPFSDDYDGIYTVFREIPPSSDIAGIDIIRAWGAPDEESYGEDPSRGIQILTYYKYGVDVYMKGPDTDSLVTGIELWNVDR